MDIDIADRMLPTPPPGDDNCYRTGPRWSQNTEWRADDVSHIDLRNGGKPVRSATGRTVPL